MKPNIDQELKVSYGILAGALLVALIAVGIFYDWGDAATDADKAKKSYLKRQGYVERNGKVRKPDDSIPLSSQITKLQEVNQFLYQRIENLKQQVGIQQVAPFIDLQNKSPGARAEFFYVVYGAVRDSLQRNAAAHSIEYDEQMGFGRLSGRPPPDNEVGKYFVMLQLISKAVFFAQHAPKEEIRSIKVMPVTMSKDVRLSGPSKEIRSTPLLREYHFRMEVRGSLKALLWLLHRLSVDRPPTEEHKQLKAWLAEITRGLRKSDLVQMQRERAVGNDVCPLIVTGLNLASPNQTVEESLTELTLVLDLAGMEFLGDEASWDKPFDGSGGSNSRPSAGGGARSGSRGSRSSGGPRF